MVKGQTAFSFMSVYQGLHVNFEPVFGDTCVCTYVHMYTYTVVLTD